MKSPERKDSDEAHGNPSAINNPISTREGASYCFLQHLVKIDSAQIRAARGYLGWSQVELAAKTGLNRTTITALERGAMEISPRSARLIAEAFASAGIRIVDEPIAGGGARVVMLVQEP